MYLRVIINPDYVLASRTSSKALDAPSTPISYEFFSRQGITRDKLGNTGYDWVYKAHRCYYLIDNNQIKSLLLFCISMLFDLNTCLLCKLNKTRKRSGHMSTIFNRNCTCSTQCSHSKRHSNTVIIVGLYFATR